MQFCMIAKKKIGPDVTGNLGNESLVVKLFAFDGKTRRD